MFVQDRRIVNGSALALMHNVDSVSKQRLAYNHSEPSVMLARLADRSADHARMWTESVVPLKRYPYRDTDKHPDFSNKKIDSGLAARSWDINVIVRPPGSSQDRSSDSIQTPFPNITILFQNGQFSGYRSHSADVSLRG